jgi:acyl dehydratase
MPLPFAALGNMLASDTDHHIDTRWLQSYAVGIRDYNPAYLTSSSSTTNMQPTHDFHRQGVQGSGVIAHPVFVWAVEWPMLWLHSAQLMAVQGKPFQLQSSERGGAVHYGEDIILHRPIQCNDALTFTTTVVEISQRKQGTMTTYKFVHRDRNNQPVATTWNRTYWRGVGIEGQETTTAAVPARLVNEMPPPLPKLKLRHDATPLFSFPIEIHPHEGIVYSECARIWNPIHSDTATAQASGLPAAILHGTASMAKCVTQIIDRFVVGRDPKKVCRVVVEKFGGVVLMPSVPIMHVWEIMPWKNGTTAVHYSLINEEGKNAIQGGFVVFRGGLASSL